MEMLNQCHVFSEHQLREALGISVSGWPRFRREHGLTRPKINKTSYYHKSEIEEFFISFNQSEIKEPS